MPHAKPRKSSRARRAKGARPLTGGGGGGVAALSGGMSNFQIPMTNRHTSCVTLLREFSERADFCNPDHPFQKTTALAGQRTIPRGRGRHKAQARDQCCIYQRFGQLIFLIWLKFSGSKSNRDAPGLDAQAALPALSREAPKVFASEGSPSVERGSREGRSVKRTVQPLCQRCCRISSAVRIFSSLWSPFSKYDRESK
jgi:hypothetical protein